MPGLPFQKRTLLFVLFGFLFSCGGSPKKQTEKTEKTEKAKKTVPKLPIPHFNADSAYHFVEKQLSFGPRVPNTMQHQLCGDFLVEKLKNFGWEVQTQAFTTTAYNGEILKGRNIIGSFNPEVKKRVLLAAHWDTRPVADQQKPEPLAEPIPGANDGASGVAVLLEMARTIGADTVKPQLGIDIIFFDVEDYGMPEGEENQSNKEITYCLGSQYWTKNMHKENYHAYFGVLLDMVGAKNARFTQEGYSRKYAPKVLNRIWEKAAEIGFGEYFVKKETEPIIDDHYIVNTESAITMIDIIHYDTTGGHPFFEHWHKQTDDLSQIDPKTLKAVGQTLLHFVYNDEI